MVDDRSSGHPPIAVVADTALDRRLQAHAQGQQILDLGARPAPLFPVAHADASSDPLVQLRGCPVILVDAKARHPASKVAPDEAQQSLVGKLRLSTLFKPDTRNPLASSRLQELSARKSAENSALDNEVLVNQFIAHAELIATFRRAEVDAAHKFGLIKAVGKKGPKAIQVAIDTAAKAAKRRDSYAKKLHVLGVSLKD